MKLYYKFTGKTNSARILRSDCQEFDVFFLDMV